MKQFTITGIAGTAKNTGKTTTLTYLLNSAFKQKTKTALTGIGYDGEEIDNITNLPKPRLTIEPNTIIATSESCLTGKENSYELLERTNKFTALGEILIIKVTARELFIIAGANNRTAFLEILNKLKNYDIQKIYVDGSLNRISPMYIADEIIFTTGASRNTDINILVKEMKTIEQIFSFNRRNLIPGNAADPGFLFDEVMMIPGNSKILYIKNPLSLKLLGKLVQKGHELILHSPINLLLSGALNELALFLLNKNLKISYEFKPKLKAITVNPFYPEFSGINYTSKYIDAEKLVEEMKVNLKTPVYNIQTGSPQF